jgi:P-type Mg2+ transporter
MSDISTLSLPELYRELNANSAGLSDAEAFARSKRWGLNEISKKKKQHPFLKLLSYFKNPLIIILLIAALISGLTGEFRNTAIIIFMVFSSVGLNFYQEHKSGRAAEEIAKKLSVRATVLRNGKPGEILTKFIVPGDIILLSAGDIVPADGKIIEGDDFFINESSLTGESFPVEKRAGDSGRSSIAYSGTNCVTGYARILIYSTGIATEYGKIAENLSSPQEVNAFEEGIKSFGFLIIKAIFFIVFAILLINALGHKNLIDSFVFSIAVAVGITPELLPMIMSVNMAKGSILMAKKGVIVKRLNAIPDFGSMDILCTDKTGTLTEDKITVVKYLDALGNESDSVLRLAYLNGFFETGIKSLLDKAILDYKNFPMDGIRKVDEVPYDFARRRSSIIFEENSNRVMVAKGAPEEIFKISDACLKGGKRTPFGEKERATAKKIYDDLSVLGFRVLAIAFKDVEDKKDIYGIEEENAMALAGFVAFFDPPKESAKGTLQEMENYGIEIKILTGDSPLVTKKVCDDLGLPIKGIISGEELDLSKLSNEELALRARNTTIFARLSPSQKERVVAALRSGGAVVGYLGDGINDAPALKTADVGISVDNAVDVARETADIILLEKGLKTLMDGVIEGRKTFGNTMKYMMMGLSSNFGNMFSMIGAALFLPFFPMLPGQILLNNFIYDCSQLAIPLDNVDEEYLKKPKHWDIKFIRNFMLTFGPISSLFDFATFFLLFSVFKLTEAHFQTGWFIESLATQIFVIYIIRTRKIPFIESRPSKPLLYSTLAAVAIGCLFTIPMIGNIFSFDSLPPVVFAAIIFLVLIYLLMVEGVKRIFYRRYA